MDDGKDFYANFLFSRFSIKNEKENENKKNIIKNK